MPDVEPLHPCEIDHREGRKDAEFSINMFSISIFSISIFSISIFSINIDDSFLGIPRRGSELAPVKEAVVTSINGEGASHCGFRFVIFVDDRACAGLSAK